MLPQGKCLVNKEPDQTVAGLSESASLPQISLLSGKKYYRKYFEKSFWPSCTVAYLTEKGCT
jgi:hypothetical protein